MDEIDRISIEADERSDMLYQAENALTKGGEA